jgi:hypothetical protein
MVNKPKFGEADSIVNKTDFGGADSIVNKPKFKRGRFNCAMASCNVRVM